MLAARDQILKQLKENLQEARNQMKQRVDLKRCDIEFQVGDYVFLKLHPFRQTSVFKRAYHKLASIYYGPFPIEEKMVKVTLPASSRIHNVFHVSLLRKFVGDHKASTSVLPNISADGSIVPEPAAILKAWSNGKAYQQKMPPGNPPRNYLLDSLMPTLRTRLLLMRGYC